MSWKRARSPEQKQERRAAILAAAAELHDSDGTEWYLRNPERAEELLRPERKAQPVWFNPF